MTRICRKSPASTVANTPASEARPLPHVASWREPRAAINFHRREGLHDKIVSVVLPRKSTPRERWLTRGEAAALIRAAWRCREKQNHRATDRYTRRHITRFMVVARYMGSRAGVICSASIAPKRPAGRSWVDLTTGLFYGRSYGERETKKREPDGQGAVAPPGTHAALAPPRSAIRRRVERQACAGVSTRRTGQRLPMPGLGKT